MNWSNCECVEVDLVNGDGIAFHIFTLLQELKEADLKEFTLQLFVLAGVLVVYLVVFPL
jgi:hypothetical protein